MASDARRSATPRLPDWRRANRTHSASCSSAKPPMIHISDFRPPQRSNSWKTTDTSHSWALKWLSRTVVNGNSSVCGIWPVSTISSPTFIRIHTSLLAVGTTLSASIRSTVRPIARPFTTPGVSSGGLAALIAPSR